MKTKSNTEEVGRAALNEKVAGSISTPTTKSVSTTEQHCTEIQLKAVAGLSKVDSRPLAKHLGIQHESLFKQITMYRDNFEAFGLIRFQIGEIDGRGRPEKFAMLNEDQALLALTFSRNTERVRQLKVKLVKAFGEARRAAEKREIEYLPEYHALHDRIKVLAAGSPNERFVHMNVNKALNAFAGIDAGQRGTTPTVNQSLLNVGQIIAARAMQGATGNSDGYQRFKSALELLTSVLALEAA